ncbi:MAG: hypothetical protein HRT53_05960 [Colwellia sp.]|nr:hypothetical protein [Colwellia sp.]
MKFVNGFTLVLVVLFLNGCASYIAHEIMNPKKLNIEGDYPEWTIEKTLCDDNVQCIKAIALVDDGPKEINLTKYLTKITRTVNMNIYDQVWQYQHIYDERQSLTLSKPLDNQLIFIFAPYKMPTKLLVGYTRWLQLMTGAEVLLIPGADKSERFAFGLEYISPIVAEIKRRQADKVHLIGFSMGAVAAQAVAAETDNAQLYLIAPMTNFKQATKAIWDIYHSKKYYAKLISTGNIEDAVAIVFDKLNISPADINIIEKMQGSKTPTYVYASNQDKIALAADWNNVNSGNISVKKYQQLTHLEMMSLLEQNLMIDFVSDLLARQVSKNETETIGILCQSDDQACLSQIEE